MLNKVVFLLLLLCSVPAFAIDTASEGTDTEKTENEAVEHPLQNSLEFFVTNGSNPDMRRMADALENLEKARIRRLNRKLPADQQIVYTKPDIDVKDRAQLAKYFGERFITLSTPETPASNDATSE